MAEKQTTRYVGNPLDELTKAWKKIDQLKERIRELETENARLRAGNDALIDVVADEVPAPPIEPEDAATDEPPLL